MFEPLPDKPDANALELAVLAALGARGHLRSSCGERNRGGPKWSFIDGPVTANKKLAIHTAWGRTLKDVFQRYKALRASTSATRTASTARASGSRSGSSAQLGLNSKREIEAFGLEEFAAPLPRGRRHAPPTS